MGVACALCCRLPPLEVSPPPLPAQIQATVLAAERPDLVAFSGDQVSGFAWSGAAGWYEQALRRLLRPVLAAGVPFATILGALRLRAGCAGGCCSML